VLGQVCLSQIKSGYICDAVRRELDGKEYTLPSQLSAIWAPLSNDRCVRVSLYDSST
jgi:hypothetical protein